MVNLISDLIPLGAVIFHLFLLVTILALLLKQENILNWIGKHALLLGFISVLLALSGSLFYSEILGYEACSLCWWQRVLLFPQLILFFMAWRSKDRGVFKYSVPLSALAAIVSLYHSYVYWGGASILPCTSEGGSCDKIYVLEFGYVTIPAMSLTIAAILLILAFINRSYKNR